jgi:hypothetical protein
MIGFYVVVSGITAIIGAVVLFDWLARRKGKRASSHQA